MNNSRILRIQNVKFSRYYFYMNTNIWRYFEICISVPLSLQTKIFWDTIFWCSADLLLSVWALWYLWCFFTTHSFQLARIFMLPNKIFWSLVPFLIVIVFSTFSEVLLNVLPYIFWEKSALLPTFQRITTRHHHFFKKVSSMLLF